jgi:hypothetical protein
MGWVTNAVFDIQSIDFLAGAIAQELTVFAVFEFLMSP